MWDQLPQTEGEERAHVLLELAQDAVNRDNGSQALVLAEEARRIYHQMGARIPGVEHARAVSGIGNALNCLHRYMEAAQVLDEAISLQNESNFQYVSDTLRVQGHWYSEAGNYEMALASFLEAVRILEIDGNEEFLAIDLYNAGRCYFRLKKYDQAITTLSQARDIFRSRRQLYEASWVYHYLAETYIAAGQPAAGLENAESCYAIASMKKDNQYLCRSALSKAKAQMTLGNFDQVGDELCEADYIASSSNDWDLMLDIQNEYLMLYRNLNRFEEAKKVEVQIATIREILG
ncbi:MAG: tetratricopeptide repeat protein [Actinomycetes bacterium]